MQEQHDHHLFYEREAERDAAAEGECNHKWQLIPVPMWIAKAKGADELPDFYRCAICGKQSGG